MNDVLEACLADLDRRLDDRQEQENIDAWLAFLDGRGAEDIFVPPARSPAPAGVEWPEVHINDALEDYDLMLLSQFRGVSAALAAGGGGRLNVRCNYGSSILPSLFGCELYVMPREMGTLPTTRPLASRDAIGALLDAGVPDLAGGFGERVFTCAERLLDVLGRYESIGRWVRLFHPDVQGPIDAAEVVWGSDIFLAFYDVPEMLRDFLDLVTETYAALMRAWYELVGVRREHNAHWGMTHKGVLMLREDSLMNLSPETYIEFIRPLDQRLFDEFGGGAIHFCGRGDHFIDAMSRMTGLTAIQLSQPHLNDMETIYRNTVDKGIALIGLDHAEAARALAAGRDLRRLVQTGGAA